MTEGEGSKKVGGGGWSRQDDMSSIETLNGLPTFNPATYRASPPKQTLSDINSRAILLNYPSLDLSKSQKGVLAPILDRAELPDPHFVKTRTGEP